MRAWPPLVSYALVIVLVAGSTVARVALGPHLGSGFRFITYFPTVAITAFLCGARPALVATVLSMLASWFWIMIPREFNTSNVVGELNFAAVCGLIIWLARALRRAQEAAQAEAFNNALILSSITDALATLDHEWRVTRLNPRATEIFRALGTDPDSAIGRSYWELFPETLGTVVESEFRRVAQERVAVSFETPAQIRGLSFDVSAYPSPAGLTIMFRDITKQRRAEETQQRLAAVVESTDDAILTNSPAGIITSWNQGAERMFGFSAAEIIGQSVFRLIPAGETAKERAVLEQINTGQRVDHYDTIRLRRDGGILDVSLTASPLRDSKGAVVGISSVVRDVAERKKAEEELRQQQEWFSVTLASIGDAVIATDANSCVTFLNPIAESMIGWPLREAVGKPLSTVFHIINEATREPVDNPISEVLRRGAIVGLANHTVLLRRDGKNIAIEDSAAPIRSKAGEILGVVMVFHDVSERREAEDRLRAAEQRLRLAMMTSKVGVWDWDLIADQISWSESLYAIYGVDRAHFVPTVESFAALLHPDDRVVIPARIQDALDGNSQYEAEFRAVRPDGTTIWLYSNASVIREGGQATRMIGATIDVTDRKRTEAQLQESRNYFQSVVETSPTLVTVIDGDAEIVLFNRACEETTGYSREAMIGRSLREFTSSNPWHPETLDFFCHAEDAELREPRVAPWQTSAGSERWIEWRCTRLSSGAGRESFLLATGVDITERRRAEHELATARDAAEAANRAKDRFLAALSHELRTPLTPVLMLAAEMARSPEVPDELRQHFETIRSNVELEARLIDDLLDVSRITAGKLQLRIKPCDSHRLIRNVLAILGAEIDAKQIELCIELSATRCSALADEVRLQQVFWNVLKNAVKFTRRGGRIAVRTWNEAEKLHVETVDTGIGLAPEDLTRIFEAFVQTEDATAGCFGGLGLGLSISSLLMKEQSGRIWANSEGRGRGATFHLEIPLIPSDIVTQAEPAMPMAIADHRYRILVVEDHEATRATMIRLLAKRGHEVESADSVANARIVAQKSAFDLVISDVGLPDGDGRALMGELYRALGMPGIALSGYGTESDVQNSLDLGFEAHLTKPVDFAQLDQTIAIVMRRREQQEA